MKENKEAALIDNNKIEEALEKFKKEFEGNKAYFEEHSVNIDEVANLMQDFKDKNENTISIAILGIFNALSINTSIPLWSTLKIAMNQKVTEHFC